MSQTRPAVVVGAATIVILLGAGLVVIGSADAEPRPTPQLTVPVPPPVAAPLKQASTPPAPTALPVPPPSGRALPLPPSGPCSTAERAFLPTSVSIPGVATTTVVALPRDAHNVPGVPALTSAGKTQMAFDLGNGVRPGGTKGNALLNAHTWPDGSALGNTLLAGLHKRDRIIVRGGVGQLCYEVTDRVEVPADDEAVRYFAETGRPQIAIVVCSGKRLGPGNWTERTLWFASPVG